MQNELEPEWSREKIIIRVYGLTRQILRSLRLDGEIRSISTKRKSAKQGCRVYHIGSVEAFFKRQEALQKIANAEGRRRTTLKLKSDARMD